LASTKLSPMRLSETAGKYRGFTAGLFSTGMVRGGVGFLLLLALLLGGAGEGRAIDALSLKKDLYYIASDFLEGRAAASEGERKAAEFIASRFRALGLRPAFGDSYFQEFEIVTGLRLTENNHLTATLPQGEEELAPGEDYIPLTRSGNGEVSGVPLLVGFGITAEKLGYDDYRGQEVEGRIVILMGMEPERLSTRAGMDRGAITQHASVTSKISNAKQHKAAAVILVDPAAGPLAPEKERLPELFARGVVGEVGIPVVKVRREVVDRWLRASLGRGLADYQGELEDLDPPGPVELAGVRLSLQVEIEKLYGKARNVAAILEGGSYVLKNEYVAVSAHYDHLGFGRSGRSMTPGRREVHNGADDNGSGTVGVLALAEALATAEKGPDRSVIFVLFSGEELGLLGSKHFSQNLPVAREQLVALINLDMIGRPKEGRWLLGGVGTSSVWSDLIDQVKQSHPEVSFTTQRSARAPSDQSSFLPLRLPVLWSYDGGHPDYHRPTDDPEKIDYEAMARWLGFIRDLVVAIADLPRRPDYKEVKGSEFRRPRNQFRVYLGTMPDYTWEGEGLRVDDVTPDSPADRYGIRAGDVILRLGPVEIKDIYDFVYALQTLAPGVWYDVVVRRGGDTVKLRVKMEARERE